MEDSQCPPGLQQVLMTRQCRPGELRRKQNNRELGAHADLTLDQQIAAHPLDQTPGYRKPQTGSLNSENSAPRRENG